MQKAPFKHFVWTTNWNKIWVDFNFRDSFLFKHDFCSSMIWNNSLVRIANRPFFYKQWTKAGAHNVKDLVNDDFTIITYREFREKYCSSLPLSLNFMEWHGHNKRLEVYEIEDADGEDQESSVPKLIAPTKPTKSACKILIRKNSTCPQTSQEKWVKDCGLELVEDLSWRTIYLKKI